MIIITNLQGESLPLTDVKSVAKKMGRNGVNEIDLVVHKTDRNSKAFDLIEREGILTVEDNDYRIKRNIREQKDKTIGFRIEAPHVFYDNIDVYQHEVHEGEKVFSLHEALAFSLENTGYTFIIKDIKDDFDNYSFENFGNDTSIALFNKAKDSFKFEFSIENKHLTIVKRLGKDNGHQLRYKHGIQTISVEDSTHDLSTYIQGFGALRKDEEGNDIEGDYLVTAEYTSPYADKYDRITEATPVDDRRFSNKDALLRQMISELNDDPTMLFTITHEKFTENLVTEMEDVGLGDVVQLIHEPLNLRFEVRIEEIISFPLHPRLKPLLTISNKPLELLDHNALSVANKQNNDKQIAELRNKNNEISRRIESAIEAVHDVENAMINVDKEMDRIENEVIPEIEQAVKDSSIPSQVDPPFPIPNSNLWNDTSQNPPRLMRWDGSNWVVLAPTEGEIDQIIEDMKNEAISQGITYTDAEVQAARSAIVSRIESEIGDVNEHVSSLEDTASNLIDRANNADELIDNKLDTLDYTKDKTGILSSIEQNTTDIETTAKGLELRVTKEEFENLEVGGANLLEDTTDEWNSVTFSSWNANPYKSIKVNEGETYTARVYLKPTEQHDVTVRLFGLVDGYSPVEHESPSGNTIRVGAEGYAYVTFTVPEGCNGLDFIIRHTERGAVNHTVHYKEAQVVKGNRAGSWQPSYKDALERITKTEATIDVHAEAIELKAEKNELVNYVDKQEYTNKTGQLDVSIDNIIGRVSNAESTVDRHTGEITSASSKIAALDVSVGGISGTVSSLSSDLNTAKSNISKLDIRADGIVQSVSAVRTDLDGLEIGGRNLLSNSDFTNELTHWRNWGSPTSTNIVNITSLSGFSKGVRIIANSSGDSGISFDGLNVVEGEYYTLSAWVYRRSGTITLQEGVSGIGWEYKNFTSATQAWQRIEYTFKSRGSTFGIYIGAKSGVIDCSFTGIQLEKGNRPTDWTAAPEDMDVRMAATETRITQLPDEIDLSVSEGIGALEIGGRNLLLNTSKEFQTYDRTHTWGDYVSDSSHNAVPVIEGETYILKAYLKHESKSPGDKGVSVMVRLSETANASTPRRDVSGNLISSESEGYSIVKFTVPKGMKYARAHTIRFNKSVSERNIILYKELKLEKGSKETGWTSAEEDGVNKTNVLSSINLSTEGIAIEAAKVDIKGLVSFINSDSTTGTMINGSRLVTGSITADELNVNQIFSNSAVIAKIQADSVKTATLDAGKITAGTLNAARIAAGTITATKLATNSVTAVKIAASAITAGKIAAGAITADKIAANAVTAGKINVNSLSALNANLGTVTAGVLSGTRSKYNLASGSFEVWDNLRLAEFKLGKITFTDTRHPELAAEISTTSMSFNGKWAPRLDLTSQTSLTLRAGTGSTAAAVRVNQGSRSMVEIDSKEFIAKGAYELTYTATTNQLRTGFPGFIGRIESSRKHKLLEKEVGIDYAKKILELEPKTWFDRRASEDFAHELTTGKKTEIQRIERIPGLIAEDVRDVGLKTYNSFDEDGEVDGINNMLWTLLIPIVKEHQATIKDLSKRLDKSEQNNQLRTSQILQLKQRIERLEGLVG